MKGYKMKFSQFNFALHSGVLINYYSNYLLRSLVKAMTFETSQV